MDFELNVELGPSGSPISAVLNDDNAIGLLRSRSPVNSGIPQDVKLEFGHCSLFDFLVTAVDKEPFELPVKIYLEEVLVGIYGASQGCRTSSKDTSDKPCEEARLNRRYLKRFLSMDSARDVVRTLFWIIVGIVTKRVVADVVSELRKNLARSWSLVVQEVRREARDSAMVNQEAMQDWILQTLPVIFVQCIYRLMVDAFADDRSQLVHYASKLLDKITHIVTYEVSGFRLNSRTCLEARRKLFRKDVLDNPFMNQHDTLKSQMRREALEHRSSKPSPLLFGQKDALPLEETQLEHVMLDREKDRVPEELSVDRYVSIAHEGEELFQRHLEELLPRILPTATEGVDGQRMSMHSSQRSRYYSDKEDEKKRRENKEAEKRKREESLKAFCDEPLPREYCECHLDTSWVSPIIDRLAPGEEDRKVLRKKGADSRQLKMELPALIQSKSEPALQLNKSHTQKLPKIHGSIANDEGESSPGHASYGSCKSLLPRTEISLEPPASLKNATVIHRLEDHLAKYNSRSFGAYAKTHDVTSGKKKHRMDPAAMRRAENAYIASMEALVGPPSQPALKLNDTLSRKKSKFKATQRIP